MQHQRNSERAPRRTGQLRPMRAGGGRHRRALHFGEADAGLLEHASALEDARAPAAVRRGKRLLEARAHRRVSDRSVSEVAQIVRTELGLGGRHVGHDDFMRSSAATRWDGFGQSGSRNALRQPASPSSASASRATAA